MQVNSKEKKDWFLAQKCRQFLDIFQTLNEIGLRRNATVTG